LPDCLVAFLKARGPVAFRSRTREPGRDMYRCHVSPNMAIAKVPHLGLRWRKARRRAGNGDCVEVAPVAGTILIRDTKDPYGGAAKVSTKPAMS
jgi:hypothetical protein